MILEAGLPPCEVRANPIAVVVLAAQVSAVAASTAACPEACIRSAATNHCTRSTLRADHALRDFRGVKRCR